MRTGHLATSKQPDASLPAETGPTPLQTLLARKKRLENALAVVHRDTWSFVVDRELQFPVAGGPSSDTDWGARWRVFERVLEQVGEHALTLNLARIHRYGRQAWRYLPPHNPLAKHAPDPVQRAIHNANRIGECQIRIGRDAAVGYASCQK